MEGIKELSTPIWSKR